MALNNTIEQAAEKIQERFLNGNAYTITLQDSEPLVALVKSTPHTWMLYATYSEEPFQIYVARHKDEALDYWFPLTLTSPKIIQIQKGTRLYRRTTRDNVFKEKYTFFTDNPNFHFDVVKSRAENAVDYIFEVTQTFQVLYFDQWRENILNLVEELDIEPVLQHTCLSYNCQGWKAAVYSDQPTSFIAQYKSDEWNDDIQHSAMHEIAIMEPSNYVKIVQETRVGAAESAGEAKDATLWKPMMKLRL